ncbi:hypothetical protein BZL43_02530 [Pseudomonas sp. PICF141]|nr:hypothetical protein BZL43_02530 [Pseudomonas sp. PICF141]
MRVFHKPVIDITAQIELLKQRGLHIQDDTRARHFLQAVSFFRLTPYMRTFQQAEDEDHPFRKGAGFRDLTTLYDFDRHLRLLVMDAIERVEVAVRSLISNHMGPNHGGHWYMEARLFQHSYDHARLLETIRTKQNAARRDYEKVYDLPHAPSGHLDTYSQTLNAGIARTGTSPSSTSPVNTTSYVSAPLPHCSTMTMRSTRTPANPVIVSANASTIF